MSRIKNKRRGFTLIELLIVVAIIGLLAAGAGYMVTNSLNNAKYAAADKDLVALKSALDQYAITHNGNFIGLLANGTSSGTMTGSSALANMDKLDPFLSKPIATLYDPWQRAYRIQVDYDTTTCQGDIVIYVEADSKLGLNAKDVDYKTIASDGTEGTFSVANIAVNPNRKVKGASGSSGEPMAIRVLGQYEIQ